MLACSMVHDFGSYNVTEYCRSSSLIGMRMVHLGCVDGAVVVFAAGWELAGGVGWAEGVGVEVEVEEEEGGIVELGVVVVVSPGLLSIVVFDNCSLIVRFWAPLIEYDITRLQEMASWVVDETISLALDGKSEERADEGFRSQLAT